MSHQKSSVDRKEEVQGLIAGGPHGVYKLKIQVESGTVDCR